MFYTSRRVVFCGSAHALWLLLAGVAGACAIRLDGMPRSALRDGDWELGDWFEAVGDMRFFSYSPQSVYGPR